MAFGKVRALNSNCVVMKTKLSEFYTFGKFLLKKQRLFNFSLNNIITSVNMNLFSYNVFGQN